MVRRLTINNARSRRLSAPEEQRILDAYDEGKVACFRALVILAIETGMRRGEPKHVYGCSLHDLETMHNELCATVRYEVAGGKTRSIRVDQHTLFTIVFSHPVLMEQIRGNPDEELRLGERLSTHFSRIGKSRYDAPVRCSRLTGHFMPTSQSAASRLN